MKTPAPAALRAETIAYYTECWAPRLRAGHNAGSHAIHYGLDLEPTPTPSDDVIDAAKLRTNLLLAASLALPDERPSHLLELGCGIGGTALHLASENPHWAFTAVDLTPASLAIARDHAAARSLAGRVRFLLADYSELPIIGSFHAAYAVETLCHAADRPRVLRELHRLLQPGAPLVVIDLFRTAEPLSRLAAVRYENLLRGYAVADYYDRPLEHDLTAAGFRELTTTDLTARARTDIDRSARRAEARLRRDGERVTTRQRDHWQACCAVGTLVNEGALAYRAVRAVR